MGGKNNQGPSAGFVVGRVLSLPFKAVGKVGKVTLMVAGKALSLAVGTAIETQRQYNSMSDRSVEDIGDIVTGKKYSAPLERAAAMKYVKDVKDRIDNP